MLPASVGRLRALRTLDLSHNRLWRLDSSIGSLSELRQLQLQHNELSDLPDSLLGLCGALEELALHSNAWTFGESADFAPGTSVARLEQTMRAAHDPAKKRIGGW